MRLRVVALRAARAVGTFGAATAAAGLLVGLSVAAVARPVEAGGRPATHHRVPPTPVIRVQGRHLVDGHGRVVRLLGINRSGAEYTCVQPYQQPLFDGPAGRRSVRAMTTWHVNAVRVPLNESCWLGVNGEPQTGTAHDYRHAVRAYVRRLNRAGLYVVLDIHWSAPGTQPASGIIPMAAADHAPAYWRSVARAFTSNHSLVFDLYNEPHDLGWRCWRDGCQLPTNGAGSATYRAAGMQQLLDAVRSTGATQPVMVGGIDWARDLHHWLAFRPHDPLHQVVASEHNYGGGLAPCVRRCRHDVARVARHVPVVVGELGEVDCAHAYVDRWMAWADHYGISYLGWTWNATVPGSWTCRGGPSLIKDWAGTPTPYGVGLRDHLLALTGG